MNGLHEKQRSGYALNVTVHIGTRRKNMSRFIDLTGKRFGRWLVLERATDVPIGQTWWLCLCDCGTKRNVIGGSLKNGKSCSCGCLMRERVSIANKKHGYYETSIYGTWCNMRGRCNNPTDKAFPNYGGRGITVCDRWNKFKNFYADMGERPEGLTLERKDNNKGYSPGNCCWTTRASQNRNKRNSLLITHAGLTLCAKDWSDRLGIHYQTLYSRLKRHSSEATFNIQ